MKKPLLYSYSLSLCCATALLLSACQVPDTDSTPGEQTSSVAKEQEDESGHDHNQDREQDAKHRDEHDGHDEHDEHDDDHHHDGQQSGAPHKSGKGSGKSSGEKSSEKTEVDELPNRIVVVYENKVQTLDASTGKVVATEELPGAARIEQVGDGRHALIPLQDKVLSYDSGLISESHGQHFHYYTAPPALHGPAVKVPRLVHVMSNAGFTSLLSARDGSVKVFESGEFENSAAPINSVSTGTAHRGLAVPLQDGSILATQGDGLESYNLIHLDKDGQQISNTAQCTSASAAAVAANGRVLFNCADGAIVFDGKKFSRASTRELKNSERLNTAVSSPESPILLADLQANSGSAAQETKRLALVDTASLYTTVTQLEHSFRPTSLARGPRGEALVLSTDGKINVIDPNLGVVTDSFAAIDPWEVADTATSTDTDTAPVLKSANGYAFIADRKNKKMVVFDLLLGKQVTSFPIAQGLEDMTVF